MDHESGGCDDNGANKVRDFCLGLLDRYMDIDIYFRMGFKMFLVFISQKRSKDRQYSSLFRFAKPSCRACQTIRCNFQS